jgi:AcrR family transcriptional regulator
MIRTKSQNVGRPIGSRLSKEAWLERALMLLAAEGPSRMRIENIAQAIGVTKGSFYHHFADRGDFVRCLVQYWDEKYTREVTTKLELQQGTAQERLWHLMLAIVNLGLANCDAAIRSWAGSEPDLRRMVEKADRFRLTFVCTLFSEMGFTDLELEMRSRIFVASMSAEGAIFHRTPAAKQKQLLQAQHTFFIRP